MTEPFSVLLPVYAGDDAGHFSRAVASATVEQELRPAELVVVQDGPVGSGLQDALAELKRPGGLTGEVPVRIVRLPENVGLAHALEAGLNACSYEIVARADADDISLPARFARQVPLVSGGLDVLGAAIAEFVEDEAHPGMVRVLPTEPAEIARTARFRDPFNHPSVVYRRSAVAAAGGYEHLPLMEDYLLFARMIARGARVANLPEPLVLYRVGEGAYARRGGWRLLRSEVALQRAFLRERFTTPPQALRNVVLRGGYRLVPERVRRRAYQRMISRG